MNHQKSRKEYISSIPLEPRLSEAPLPKPQQLAECLWHYTGECKISGIREFLKKSNIVYDGVQCKCFAYLPAQYYEKKAKTSMDGFPK